LIEIKLHQNKICLVNGKKQIKSENMMLVSIFISLGSFNDGVVSTASPPLQGRDGLVTLIIFDGVAAVARPRRPRYPAY
jgi:hypothetical protein